MSVLPKSTRNISDTNTKFLYETVFPADYNQVPLQNCISSELKPSFYTKLYFQQTKTKFQYKNVFPAD